MSIARPTRSSIAWRTEVQETQATEPEESEEETERMWAPDPASVAEAEARKRSGLKPGQIRVIQRPRADVMAELPKCVTCGANVKDRRYKWCEGCSPQKSKAKAKSAQARNTSGRKRKDLVRRGTFQVGQTTPPGKFDLDSERRGKLTIESLLGDIAAADLTDHIELTIGEWRLSADRLSIQAQ
jgi:hypothetical protein